MKELLKTINDAYFIVDSSVDQNPGFIQDGINKEEILANLDKIDKILRNLDRLNNSINNN